jgi:tRNA threonylcarbamoyladenosine biosynthesis protein TsaB
MNALAVDCSTDLLSFAIRIGDRDYECGMDAGFSHSEKLVSLIDEGFKALGSSPRDLSLLVAGTGPGSFTGVRIGMSTVKGIGFALGIPTVFVPSLDAFAYGLEHFGGTVVPVVDAKKARVYAAVYEGGTRVSEYLDLSVSELAARLDPLERVLFTGPDADLAGGLDRPGWIVDALARRPAGIALLELGIKEYADGGRSLPEAGPLYLRKSEAEIGITIREPERGTETVRRRAL